MQRNENGISMKIVVIGATGLVGSIVVHLLTEHGHDALVGEAAQKFFQTATPNLLSAEGAAGVAEATSDSL